MQENCVTKYNQSHIGKLCAYSNYFYLSQEYFHWSKIVASAF